MEGVIILQETIHEMHRKKLDGVLGTGHIYLGHWALMHRQLPHPLGSAFCRNGFEIQAWPLGQSSAIYALTKKEYFFRSFCLVVQFLY